MAPPSLPDPAPADPLQPLSPSQRALLRLLCWLAWCDYNLAEEERDLLQRVLERTLPAGNAQQAAAALNSLASQGALADVEALVADLESDDDRLLAVKLAYQMACVNQRPEDGAAINAAERGAYRRLLEALALPDEQVREAEWAARSELEQAPSLLGMLGRALGGFGAWPAAADGEAELRRWL